MTTASATAARSARPWLEPAGEDTHTRLLRGLEDGRAHVELAAHLRLWGALDTDRAARTLLAEVDASGLTGRGGGGFPVGAKWRALGRGRRPVVVANGAEGEPASAKDAVLLARTPHLVLDGATAAAASLGACRVVAYVPRRLVPTLRQAVGERVRWGLDEVPIEVVGAPTGFLAGQEAAVVNVLNGGPPTPTFQGLTPVRRRGVEGRPTLVHNVETLAHVALVARFGAAWFRQLGTEASPGTTLLTVSGRGDGPVVLETAFGVRVGELLGLTQDAAPHYAGALLGGYGGTWLPLQTLLDLELCLETARRTGAVLGPGVLLLLGRSTCPLAEVARVVRFLDAQSAGQCGPCVHGLAGLTTALSALAWNPARLGGSLNPVLELCALVEGRGACRHPDGVARFVTSACEVFGEEVDRHLRAGPCPSAARPGVLPLGRQVVGARGVRG
jgi:NADH:ubiquinone oxidoreductase subunit F (NADH-binding)